MTRSSAPVSPPCTTDNVEALLQEQGLLQQAEAEIRKHISPLIDQHLRLRARSELGYGRDKRLRHHVTRDLRNLKLKTWYDFQKKPRSHLSREYLRKAEEYIREVVRFEQELAAGRARRQH